MQVLKSHFAILKKATIKSLFFNTVIAYSEQVGTSIFYEFPLSHNADSTLQALWNLRDAIPRSGISQKEIAKRLGINPSTVSKYMRLDIYPALDTFAEICKILDLSSDEILGLN